jgi:hypothetical protein
MYYVNNIVCETHRENHANGKSPKGFIPLSLSFSEKWHRMGDFFIVVTVLSKSPVWLAHILMHLWRR